MLFHTQVFVLVFLPVVLLGYYATARSVPVREWFVIAASLVFYGWWDVRFLPLVVGHVVVSWTLAHLYCRTGRRWLLHAAIAANLASLCFFKYTNFLIETAIALTRLELPRSDIILPIGISFFTFQLVSYLVDLLRGEAPAYPLRRLLLFVVFFPHLIAGPIVRHDEIMAQFSLDPRRPGLAERLSRAAILFLVGFLVKVMIADKLAVPVDRIYAEAATATPGLFDAWTAMIGFALQIFFDFAAYSEMAIGLALMFGLHFPLNFNQPYRATSLRDFWRRWHMTLSRFLRDYLYIPLGGSRQGAAVFVFATIATMGLCGLWHGAGWAFVVWGLMHGVALVVCRGWQAQGLELPDVVGWAITVLFAAYAFVIFRSPDLETAWHVTEGLAGIAGIGAPPPWSVIVLLIIGGALALQKDPNPVIVGRALKPDGRIAVAAGILAAYLVLEVGRGQPLSFIYFQF